jgi:hypothetical protein
MTTWRENPTLGDMNDLEGRPGLTLCMSARGGLETADSGHYSWAAGQAALSPPQAFSLLSGSEADLKAWDLRLPPAGGEARLERVCGISRGSGCCTLLLYSRPGRSNYVSDQWS